MRPVIIPRSGHPLSRRDIDPYCLKVLYRLYRAGHAAYLVGGGVRDLLLGIPPKDFDVSTDAHPHQIKRLFRNCVLVGRRFRLAHVRFGSTIIEVSTFRCAPRPNELEGEDGDLLIRRDNTFGTPEDDAKRRDFTVNALFYDIGTFSIIDYVGGLRDLEDGLIRSIGEPAVRFQEDPVRMLRAIKLSARLGLEIHEKDLATIEHLGDKVLQASVPRLLDETYKILRGGGAAAAFKLLAETRVLDHLLPPLAAHLARTGAEEAPESAPFYRSLFALDAAVRSGVTSRSSNSYLLAALLLPLLAEHQEAHGAPPPWELSPPDVNELLEDVARPVTSVLTVARRDFDRLRHVLGAQQRLTRGVDADRRGRATPLERRPWFHEAVDVLALASELDAALAQVAAEWAEVAAAVEPVREPRPVRRGRGRRRSRAGRPARDGEKRRRR